jgi:hypothetical protein
VVIIEKKDDDDDDDDDDTLKTNTEIQNHLVEVNYK